jgi:hypothetical protein
MILCTPVDRVGMKMMTSMGDLHSTISEAWYFLQSQSTARGHRWLRGVEKSSLDPTGLKPERSSVYLKTKFHKVGHKTLEYKEYKRHTKHLVRYIQNLVCDHSPMEGETTPV